MSSLDLRRLALLVTAVQVGMTGCATPSRLPAVPANSAMQASTGVGNVRYLVSRDVHDFQAEAAALLQKERDWQAKQGNTGPLPPAAYLAVSGGGDNGAYGAGFLNGWTEAGTRPEFKLVTGVSTGALIAPFAFLGPRYDPVLKRFYTTISAKDIFKKRGLSGALFGDAFADTGPLAKQIDANVNQALLNEIAGEYAKGRVLLVGTANLDTLEPVIWNMTAIAASKDPGALALFRSVLRASASIPGAFPPVMINVSVGSAHYQEMHADGGTTAQVFLFPPSLDVQKIAPGMVRKRTLYIIRNARLDSEWQNVKRRTFPIASRAIDSLTRTQGIGDLYRIFATTQRDGIDFNLTYIPATFDAPHPQMFDTAYMRSLYELGRQTALANYKWQKYPPGYRPEKADTPAAADAK